MKYAFAITCFVVGVILFFDLKEIENINSLYASIFFMLTYIFFNMKQEN